MLAKYFFELPDQIKEEMQERIPLKILTKVHEGSRRESLQMSGKSGLKG